MEENMINCREANAGAHIGGKPWKVGEECEFMYLPAGMHSINAGFRGKGIALTVRIDPSETTPVIQASLDSMVSATPKLKPFGCVEHDEREASVWPKSFRAKDDGVYCVAEPSTLGERNVNGKIHRSWSPSFTTDADYAQAKLQGPKGSEMYVFPEGVRGSMTNPAVVTGIGFVVGTLTNKPAFRNISPVKARQTEGRQRTVDDVLADLRARDTAADTIIEREARIEEVFKRLRLA